MCDSSDLEERVISKVVIAVFAFLFVLVVAPVSCTIHKNYLITSLIREGRSSSDVICAFSINQNCLEMNNTQAN